MANTLLGRSAAGEFRKFGFLRGNLRAILVWPLLSLLSGALLWSIVLSKIDSDRAALKESTLRQATALSRSYSEQLSSTIQQIDQITLNLRYYWKQSEGNLKLDEQVQHGLYPISSRLYVTIIDRHGTRISSTLGNNRNGPNLANRDYFKQHQNDRSPDLLISTPTAGLRSGKSLVRFSRRLDTSDGSFDGMVVVSVDPAYLASFYKDSALHADDFLGVLMMDGTPLAYKNGASSDAAGPVFHMTSSILSDKEATALPGDRFVDRKPRVVARQVLSNYPLSAVVGLSEEALFSSHRQTTESYRNIAIAGSLCLLVFAVVGMTLSSRLAWRKQQADEVRNAYRMATEEAREGFYMVRAIYDQQHQIVDFLLEDCNERGAAFVGMSRAKLIGMKFSELYSGDVATQVFATFVRAMDTGFYEDEYSVSPQSPVRGTWMHRKLMRAGDTLAITLRDISDTKAHEQELAKMANTDVLTMLPNRHWLMGFLPTALEAARSSGKNVALLFVDLDDFKNINDTLGHAAGDELLQAAALRLRSVIRPHDNVVRLGGDEFTIILEGVESNDDVSRVAERIVDTLREPFTIGDGQGHTVHGSIGISLYPQDGEDAKTLLKHADIAMYAAKANGKAHYQFFQPQLSETLVVRLNREHALRAAIERDEFVLYYQPRVDTFSGELRSMEALVRWKHPERGMVPPLEFISMAEDTGLIVKLGELVIQKACAQLAQWKAARLPLVPVSINVSPRQFNQGNVSTLFVSNMEQHGIDASLIEIEITESCMMGEGHAVGEQLAAIEALGIKLLVDDFGTGYSSLSQLQQLDLDVLKIDKAFTARVCNGKEGEAFFMAILSMAHVLGISVVAEGVETEEQLKVLQALSCNEVQGYYISKPVPAAEMPALMKKRFLFPMTQQALCATE